MTRRLHVRKWRPFRPGHTQRPQADRNPLFGGALRLRDIHKDVPFVCLRVSVSDNVRVMIQGVFTHDPFTVTRRWFSPTPQLLVSYRETETGHTFIVAPADLGIVPHPGRCWNDFVSVRPRNLQHVRPGVPIHA